ncbi:unnamed protein product [Paramecium primaurelia]|uniref:Uncharacterized protein n=1 Tax=Paramecium primaurelia TaxID=5886 RepID=A0A8S1PKD1_PARPR|nr:unnamed protein product [Paramecium primaurelia]
MNYQELEQHQSRKQITLNDAMFTIFKRAMIKSPCFIPFIIIMTLLFAIGILHETGIKPIHEIFPLGGTTGEFLKSEQM